MKTFLLTQSPRIRRYVLLGLVIGVPAFFLRMAEDPFNAPKLALLMAGAAVVAGLRIAEILQGADASGLKRLWFPAVAIAAPLTLSWLFTPYRWYGLFGHYGRFQGLIPYLVVIAFGILLADAFAGRARELGWAVVVAGGFVGAYALIQIIGADPFTWAVGGVRTNDALSSIGNTNFSGGLLGITIPLGIGWIFVAKKKRRNRAILLTALMVGGCYFAYSQGGWAAALAGTTVTLGFGFAPRFRFARLLGVLGALVIAAGLAGAVVYTIVTDEFGPFPYTVISRGWWWEAATGMALEHPIVGGGPNTFYVEGAEHRPVADALYWNFNIADDPHSVYFAFLSNAGVLGLMGFVAAFGWVAYRTISRPPQDWIGAAFLGSIAAYFTQALITIDEVSLRLALWVALAGYVVSFEPRPPEPRPARARRRRGKRRPAREPLRAWPAVALVTIATLGALYFSGLFLVADGRVHQGNVLFAQGLTEPAQREYERALGTRNDYEYRRRFARSLGQVAAQQQQQGSDDYDRALEALSYLDDFPQVSTLIERARLVFQQAALDPELLQRAVAYYEEAFEIDPLNPIIRTEYADALIAVGRPDEAVSVLEAFVPEMSEGQYPQFWGELALARALTGDESAAQEAIEVALALDPENSAAQRAQEEIGEEGGS